MPSGVALYCSILRYWFSCLICIHRMKSQNEKQKLVPTWQVPSQKSLVNLELLTFCWVRRQSISFWDFPPTPSQVVEVHIDMFLTFVVTCQGNVDWSAVTWQRDGCLPGGYGWMDGRNRRIQQPTGFNQQAAPNSRTKSDWVDLLEPMMDVGWLMIDWWWMIYDGDDAVISILVVPVLSLPRYIIDHRTSDW